MRFFYICLLTLQFMLFANDTYYKSNNSGIILDEITLDNLTEYFVVKETDLDKKETIYKLYNNDNLLKTTIEYYNQNFTSLVKIEIIKESSTEIEFYDNNRLTKLESYKKGELNSYIVFYYDKNWNLSQKEYFNSNSEINYTDIYHRKNDGGLRKLERINSENFIQQWIYNNGLIVETWLIEGSIKTRSLLNSDGKVKSEIVYREDELVSIEEFEYSSIGNIKNRIKKIGNERVENFYGQTGLLLENKVYIEDILQKKTAYSYLDNLIKEIIITGHGKRERVEYMYISGEDEPYIKNFYINNLLDKKIMTDKENEIIEYYKNDMIFLKEYFASGEKVKKDFYLDGKLFKSENYSE